MLTSRQISKIASIRFFMILLLIALVLPASPALADSPTPPPSPYEKQTPVKVPVTQSGTTSPDVTAQGNLIADPSFEASFGSQAYWSQYSANLGTPLCTLGACGNGGGTAKPHSGSVWVWFGGIPVDESAVVTQNVIFPNSCGVTLQFYFWIGYAQAGSDTLDKFVVAIDHSTVIFSANATQKASYPSYKLVTLNVSSFADGNIHSVDFVSSTTGQLVTFNLDDVSLVSNCSSVNVNVGGLSQGSYTLAPNQSKRVSYAGLNQGPVKVINTGGVPIVASERVSYSPDGGTTWTSYSEIMGLPANQLTTSYMFPWYNNVDLNSQLRFANVGAGSTTISVTIGGVLRGMYPLAANQSTRISYPALNSGPVKITSSGGVPIIASMRVAYFDGSAWTSYSEMMGLPSGKLTSSYIFPWYNNVDLDSQLRFGNVGTTSTTVTVTVGGVVAGTYPLLPNQSTRASYPDLNDGPVKVTSSGGVPIIASMRVAYTPDGTTWPEFAELMGMPISSLSTSYSFPAYNNVGLNTQLRFGNVGTSATTVTVTIGGVVKGSFPLLPNASQRVSYPVDGGPVVIQSTGGVPIIASERVAYFDTVLGKWTSFAEMMGLPKEQLTSSYLFPWYNNADLNTQLRFGIP